MNINEAVETMKLKGFKVTGQREELLEIFAENNKYLTAKEILTYMQKTYPGISFDTIYRNLSLFHDLNILEQTELDGEKLFRYTCESGHHHHHFICLQCGATKAISTCPMNFVTDDLAKYEIENHKFEIYGRCPKCTA